MQNNRTRRLILFVLKHPLLASINLLSLPLLISVLSGAALYSHSQINDQRTNRERSPISKEATDQAIADYTYWLTAFTGILALSTGALWWTTKRGMRDQSRDMASSLRIAKISAENAKVSADAALKVALATEKQVFAAIASMLPIMRYDAPELLSVDSIVPREGVYIGIPTEGQPDRISVVPSLTIHNVGKTQADLRIIDFGWVVGGFEQNPRYGQTLWQLPPIDAGDTEQIDCGPFNIVLTDEALLAVSAQQKTLNFFCRVEYADFVGGHWAETATWEWNRLSVVGAFGFLRNYGAPEQYNQKRRIWEPDESTRDRPRHVARSA